MRSVDTLYLVRAIGICAVVLNHSVRLGFNGGLNVLLLLSGISFASLVFENNERPVWRISYDFIRPLLIGTLVLCTLWFAVKMKFTPSELFMFSNWITVERVSLFPIWYTQVLLQILIVVTLVFAMPGARALMARYPVFVSFLALTATVAVAAFSKLNFFTEPLADKLPHLHIWNFVLGWLFWAALFAQRPGMANRLTLSALAIAAILIMFPVLQLRGWEPRLFIFTLPMLYLIWFRKLYLPRWLAHPILLVSQATLFIFFVHYPIIRVGEAVLELFFDRVPTALQFLYVPFSLLGSVLLWAAVTATRRVVWGRRWRGFFSDQLWGRARLARLLDRPRARSSGSSC